MADTILTESEASLAVEDLGWRYLLDCLTTAVTVDSLFDACEVIRAAVDIAGPRASATAPRWLRLTSAPARDRRPSGTHAGDTWQISSDCAGR